jgi:dihydroflavonol-4-reductase
MSNHLSTPIFVTGGTGFLGAYLLRHLLIEGYTNIRALRQASSKMDLVESFEGAIEWVEGNILDIVGLESAMQGIKKVYHCAAVVSFYPSDRQKMMEVNVEGTANVVNIALHLGIEKLVHVSSVAAIGRSKEGSTLNENSKWERSPFNTNYAISKFKAEQEVWRGIAEGLNAAIVNPGIIMGSSRWDEGSARFFELVWKGYRFYPVGTASLVDIRDVVSFMTKLMESDIRAERYILHATSYTYKQLLSDIAKHLDCNPPTIKVTPFLRSLAWRLAWIQSLFNGKKPLLTKETANNSSRTFYYDHSKSLQVFDFEYTPIKTTIEETAKQFKAASENDFQAKLLPEKIT